MRKKQQTNLSARKLATYAQTQGFRDLAGKKGKSGRCKVSSVHAETARKWCFILAAAILLIGLCFILF